MHTEFRRWPRNPSYRAGDDGTILRPSGEVFVPTVNQGRPKVNVYVDRRRVLVGVHVMVCEAFHGPRPEGLQAVHWDDDPFNNRAGNLRWATAAENAADAARNGLLGHYRGIGHHLAKLDPEKVRAIRARLAAGASIAGTAREFGVATNTVRQIVTGQSWAHVA